MVTRKFFSKSSIVLGLSAATLILPVTLHPAAAAPTNARTTTRNAQPIKPLPPVEQPGALRPYKKPTAATPTPSPQLVIKLSERRVYLYRDNKVKAQYPIAIGKPGWETPTGNFKVIEMERDPAWQHPLTGKVIGPGADNPLGRRWIGFWTDGSNLIGFHGTPNEKVIGQAVSHGCVRMRNKDIIALFEQVSVGTPVIVQP